MRVPRRGRCIHDATLGGDHGVWDGGHVGRGARSEDGTKEVEAAVPPWKREAWRPRAAEKPA